ncbi:hypothetical protein NDU88_008484 [Pleurodeles waltl]|uniref:Uncharacterized protein n=1 Tax=Pleurodeles waltl TaxID=8319 RepID=A0AAV7RW83_PLEWA|nr:hypothetical protein NDU88_008484 [Pleurodeles waltl]
MRPRAAGCSLSTRIQTVYPGLLTQPGNGTGSELWCRHQAPDQKCTALFLAAPTRVGIQAGPHGREDSTRHLQTAVVVEGGTNCLAAQPRISDSTQHGARKGALVLHRRSHGHRVLQVPCINTVLWGSGRGASAPVT